MERMEIKEEIDFKEEPIYFDEERSVEIKLINIKQEIDIKHEPLDLMKTAEIDSFADSDYQFSADNEQVNRLEVETQQEQMERIKSARGNNSCIKLSVAV